MDKIKNYITEHEEELKNFRMKLHKEPELSFEEIETTNKIIEELEKEGISYKRVNPTGVIAEIKGKNNLKTVALRADMDALRMQELNDELDYKSQIEGKMHGCGHDAHVSMLLFAAKALNSIKDELNGNVRLLFQPAEEIAKGAKVMIDQGAMDGVNHIFGIHVWPELNTGEVSCVAGPSFAAVDVLKINFEGKGGHGAMPHTTVDAVVIASSFVQNLQSIVSRETDPLEPAVVTIGKMDVGTSFNIIAQNAYLEGTIRTFSKQTRDDIQAAITRYANGVADTYRAKVEIEYTRNTQALINDEKSSQLVNNIVSNYFGKDAVCRCKPTTGGEDFGYFMDYAPGSFALLGVSDPEKEINYNIHHGKFNVDNNALKYGAQLYALFARDYLNQNDF